MRKAFENKVNIILLIILGILAVVIAVAVVVSNHAAKNQETVPAYIASATNSTIPSLASKPTEIAIKEEVVTIKKEKQEKKEEDIPQTTQATEETTEPESTEETETTTSPFATAPTQKTKASYKKQWDKGYLFALDYPDEKYSCPHVELSDENRELIEKICLAEFGTGGFNGAALIAQSIKNAMVYYETDDVEKIIGKLKYSGRKSANSSKTVQDAIIYVFDMDLNAVQHRILYKYNPDVVGGISKFHESKEYVCTYNNVRFFDEP